MLAIEHGAFLAQLFKADIVLVHVMEKNWQPFNIVEPEIQVKGSSELADKIEARLQEIGDDILKKYGVRCTTFSTSGNICGEIISLAKENNVDLIVMGTHGVSGFEEFFIGSNAYKVVTRAENPVISVQSHAKKMGFSNILVPLDGSDHSRQKVDYVMVLAKKYGAKVHILGLLDDENEQKFDIKIDQVQHVVEKTGLTFTRKVIRVKNQAVQTVDYAESIGVDLIVIMTDQEEVFSGKFLGQYAQQIVNHSKVPVMSIHPNLHPYTFNP